MIRLRTFGAVTLERDGIPLKGRNTQRRRLALLVLLASARRKPVSRDRLLGLLWPERDQDRGRHALAQLVYELRRDLGASVITGGADDLVFDDDLTSDVGDFEDALQVGSMERAVAVYAGPFLDGFFVSGAAEFERWAEARRRELATKHVHAVEMLAVAATNRGDFSAAAELRLRVAALDPLSARHALAAMNALARAGDRPAAIHHAQLYAQVVRGELDVDAEPSVTQLAAELARPANPERALPAAKKPAVVEDESAPPNEPPDRERRWRRSLRASLPLVAASLLLFGGGMVLRALRVESRATARLVVLGEIASPDTLLSLAAREVVRAELERTPDVIVLDDGVVASTLRLMKLPPTVPLTEAVADDVALRNGASLVIVGRIATLGSSIEIVARLLDPTRTTPMAVLSTRPRTNDDVVRALAEIGSELRGRATRARVDNGVPLPAITTSSLEALRAYTLARAALARLDRPAAIAYGEAAVAHDSDFALAHYLVGDLLWYVDQEHRAEEHLGRAYRLSARLPVRERLLVRARYAQVVLDRPDSALGYWRALRAAYPRESLGYEGAVWTDLATGAFEDAAAAADSALGIDSTAAPQIRNRMIALLALRDTARALALARGAGARWPYLEQQVRIAEYLLRADLPGLQRLIDSIAPPVVRGRPNMELAPTRQALLLSLGRVREAANYGAVVIATLHAQFAIRAELFQARNELSSVNGSPERGRALLRAAITRLDSTDLSPPATARLAELAAFVAAAAGDQESLATLRAIVAERDAGRNLRSHVLAQITIDAADAFVHGDYASAIRQLDRTRAQSFYGRSECALALLQADALRLAGARTRADSLYSQVSTPGRLRDDGDAWLSLRPIAIANLASAALPRRGDVAAMVSDGSR
ncbi:MAG TPA: BTAD domain-containing putative transcriptional regulator [Gemmatimonadaceae bacterium]